MYVDRRVDAWRAALRLQARYQQAPPRRFVKARIDRTIPSVLVNMGDLIGVIYRSDRGPAGEPRQYLHLFDLPPRLACAPDGKQLFVLGGNYRVGRRGIEG